MHKTLIALLERETVVVAREFPSLQGCLARAARTGWVTRVLPGTFALPEVASLFEVRALAVCRRYREAVLLGASAAKLTYAAERAVPSEIHASGRGVGQMGFRFERRAVPEEFLGSAAGVRFTLPAWTALDLALETGPSAIDEALRLGVKLDHLSAALTHRASHRGTTRLRHWLHDSREQPWSPAERAGHLALTEGGVTGWHGNYPVRVPTRLAYLDIGLPHLRLGFEIDGYEHHSTKTAFTVDRIRDAELGAENWYVVRFPASLVLTAPGRFVELVRAIIRHRAGLLGISEGHP